MRKAVLLLHLLGSVVTGQEVCSEEGAVRLDDGPTLNHGRVEICISGDWGTVCDTLWGVAEASVVCRELGYGNGLPITRYGGITFQTKYFISCTGDEARLYDCNPVVTFLCNNVGVICYNETECNETDVRLVDGRTPVDGRVEICLHGLWGSVCDDDWAVRDAAVVCQQLDYGGVSVPLSEHRVLSNGTFYHLDDVACTGNENLLADCSHAGVGEHNCGVQQEEAGVICNVTAECSETEVRLVDGRTPVDGRVEICLHGLWGSVCDDDWTVRHAAVVCQQLDYGGVSVPLSEHRVLSNGTFYHLDDVACTGNENLLADCSHAGVGEHNCGVQQEEAGVICNVTAECSETEVRLMDGLTPDDGRVEICLYGLWGSVCDDAWDYRDAHVVCQQLGYDGPSHALIRHFAVDPPPYHLDDVWCTGAENMLSECRNSGVGEHNCDDSESAGVICINRTSCVEGSVYLLGGDGVTRGRVQYCYNGAWHSVCADNWDTTGIEARVICESAGYDTSGYVPSVIDYGRGTSPILPVNIQCASGASTLSDCFTPGLDVSQCSDVAGVDCRAPCVTVGLTNCASCLEPWDCFNYSPTLGFDCNCYSDCFADGDCCSDIALTRNCFLREGCEHGVVRLVGGVTNSTGRLEFCAHGVWGRVCNTLEYWGTHNARVVCRQLGFSEDRASIIDHDSDRFGVSTRNAVIGDVDCIGNEPEVVECFYSSIGDHRCIAPITDPDIIISCYDEERGCENGEVRLIAGVGLSDGFVEVCVDGTWVGVCSDGFNLNSARDICDQLTFDPQDAILIEGLQNTDYDPVFLSRVTCEGSEQHFNECSHARPPNGGCTQAAISCGKSSNQPRCTVPAGTSSISLTDNNSYGQCSVYTAQTDVCEGVVRLDIDYVYARSRLGTQSTIARMLNDNVKSLGSIIGDEDRKCLKIVYRALCHFYLPPCGNASNLTPPTSICPEECEMVRENCAKTWSTVLLAFNDDMTPLIDCDDTSSLLFPLPHCCTGAGLDAAVKSLSDGGSSSETDKEDASVTGAVVGVVVFILLAVLVMVGVMLLLVLSSKRHKRKQLERMQLDILAIPGHDAPAVLSVTETTMTVNNVEMELDGKGDGAVGAGIAGPNPYSEPISTRPATESTSSLQVSGARTRVPSYHMRELARGKLLVKNDDITLLECIGEGEFGIVYKARLGPSKREVAVKTLKGDFDQVEVDKFVEESLKMSRFKHAHVMGLVGVCLDAGSAPYIIMPYMANGSLLKWLKKERKNIVLPEEADEDEVREVGKRLMVMCSQITSGMDYLAADKYVHRDLAARNCMIDTHFLIKITDFGLSEDVFERNYFRQNSSSGEVIRLPIKWMAPESLSDGHFSEKSDVWSYGVTMWEIFSGGKAPYPGTDPLTLMQSLEKGKRMPQPYNAACSQEIYGIMRQCWCMEPGERPTFKELSSNVSKCIERVAGYLQFGFNPFAGGGGGGEGRKGGEMVETEKVDSVEIQVFPPSLPADTVLNSNKT